MFLKRKRGKNLEGRMEGIREKRKKTEKQNKTHLSLTKSRTVTPQSLISFQITQSI